MSGGNSSNNSNRSDGGDDDEGWGSKLLKVASAAAAAAAVAGGLYALVKSSSSSNSEPEAPLQSRGGRVSKEPDNIPSPQIRWTKPEPGWVKLNVDGSKDHIGDPSAGCGGVLRDESGEWLLGFEKKLDPSCEVHETELMAILKGMELAWEMNVEKLVVESDLESAVSMVKNGCKSTRPQFDLISRIKELFDRKWQVEVCHIHREANGVANILARHARNLLTDILRKYPYPPENCICLVKKEKQGVSYY